MELKELQVLGAYVPRKLIKKEVPINRPVLKPKEEWADAEIPEFTGERSADTITVHIRKRDSADFMEMTAADDRERVSIALLRSVCKPDGSPVFESVEQVNSLAEWLFIPLMVAVGEVNSFESKNSQPRMSSGAKSPSSSARQSKKRNSASVKKSAQRGSPTVTSAAP